WPELLKQIAPRVTRAGVIRDPTAAGGGGQMGAIQAVAPSFGLEVSPIDSRDPGEIERAITAFARGANGGLIVTANVFAALRCKLIMGLTARHQLPAVHSGREWVVEGGLVSYGVLPTDNYRRAADYIDRILRGEKPADLPVQAPTRYETVLNLKTAKAMGLQVPDVVRLRADEVIE